jgi:diaminopimelate epimerase
MGDCELVTTVSLLKYHALGNDFLISLDAGALTGGPGDVDVEADLVRSLCDRRRGVGADGLIVVRPPQAGGHVAMELRNADGGRAETSGNGLRCFALALVDSGLVASRSVQIETDGGLVSATVGARPAGGCADVTVSMGRLRVGPATRPAPMLGERFEARSVDAGNPHLVLIGPTIEGVDIATIGPLLEHQVTSGRNVEAVARNAPDSLDLVVWERGAGLTEACGSGSCAAAAAARASGLVGDRVAVRNPGGTLVVELSGSADEPEATLSGPACRVARVVVDTAPGGGAVE